MRGFVFREREGTKRGSRGRDERPNDGNEDSLPPPSPASLLSRKTDPSTGTYFCVDKSVTAVVIKGLAEHKDELGAPLCPCRHYDDKEAEAAQGFWNCPCVPMRERKECHCMLFLTEDNDFRGEDAEITLEEVISHTEGLSGTS